jgi:hypothetical protein
VNWERIRTDLLRGFERLRRGSLTTMAGVTAQSEWLGLVQRRRELERALDEARQAVGERALEMLRAGADVEADNPELRALFQEITATELELDRTRARLRDLRAAIESGGASDAGDAP